MRDEAAALAALARAAGVVAVGMPRLTSCLEAAGDAVLDQGNRLRRAGFLRCSGCAACAEPLPLLAGDV